jgi:hypothetical protein
VVAEDGGAEEVSRLLMGAIASLEAADLVRNLPRADCQRAKYDEFLPEDLLKKGFAMESLDVAVALNAAKQLLA